MLQSFSTYQPIVWGGEEILIMSVDTFFHNPLVWQIAFLISVMGIVYLYISGRIQRRKIRQFMERRTNTILSQKEQIEKQKDLLEKESKKSEDLLKDVFPAKIAKVLKNKGTIEPDYYEQASVLFADIVSFSKITPQITANELVETLNLYFKEFDKVIGENKMILIKTIGDSYFAAGGLPKKNKKNPIYTTLAGLQMQHAVKQINAGRKGGWQIKIGINTGELASGVLDTKRPMFDVWGSSVNVASRLQDSCEPGRVNVSETTYLKIYPFFMCEERGKIQAKNVGKISMYYVNRIKPELSADEEGLVPNKMFWKYVRNLKNIEPDYIRLTNDVISMIKEKLPQGIYYHTENHALNIMNAVEFLGFGEEIYTEDILLLKTAALLHDIGFVEQYDDNEEIGVSYCKKLLPNYGFRPEQIAKVSELIRATKMDHKPKSLLEEIMKDADLDYLGRDDFRDISNKLMKEYLEHNIVKTEKEFLEKQVTFLKSHMFLTDTAKTTRIKKKKENIKIAEELYNSQAN